MADGDDEIRWIIVFCSKNKERYCIVIIGVCFFKNYCPTFWIQLIYRIILYQLMSQMLAERSLWKVLHKELRNDPRCQTIHCRNVANLNDVITISFFSTDDQNQSGHPVSSFLALPHIWYSSEKLWSLVNVPSLDFTNLAL